MSLDEARTELTEAIPEAVRELIKISRRPERNSQTKLAAIKEILNRGGLPAVAATTISNPQGGPVEIVLRVVDPKPTEGGA